MLTTITTVYIDDIGNYVKYLFKVMAFILKEDHCRPRFAFIFILVSKSINILLWKLGKLL